MLHVDQQIALDNYLKVNGRTFENIELVKWSGVFLKLHRLISVGLFVFYPLTSILFMYKILPIQFQY
ncbi:hypothetical protein DU508_19895 [Pedobacter chinensis]|uniref:Uncharacterized protein n=1 Tax=Pedobacter chinensis TaxID=2282421 RepID=A0A369PXF0_9SPHI|nr:hypothetical protein DU508_19895 [Pedobacter chinensis]